MSDRVFALALGDGRLTPAMTREEVDQAVAELVKKAVTAVYIVAQENDEGGMASMSYERLASVELQAGVDWELAYQAAKLWAEDPKRKVAVAVPEIAAAPKRRRRRRSAGQSLNGTSAAA